MAFNPNKDFKDHERLPDKYFAVKKKDGSIDLLYVDSPIKYETGEYLDLEQIKKELESIGVRVCSLDELPSFDDIVGREKEKELIRAMKAGSKWLKEVRKSVLFHGPAGTGKTHFIRASAKELIGNKKGVFLDVSSIESPYIGETDQRFDKLRDTVKKLRKAGYEVAIMMDEVDRYAPNRSQIGGSGKRDTTTATLRFVEDAIKSGAYVFAATNDPKYLDEAFKSRMGHTIHMGLPDEKMLEGVIKNKISDKSIAEQLISLGLHKKLHELGADLRNVDSVLELISLKTSLQGKSLEEATKEAIAEFAEEKEKSKDSFV